MIPPDTSMPTYDPPLSVWPGIIALALGLLILSYLVTRITRDYRRLRTQQKDEQTSQRESENTTGEPGQ